MNIAIILRELKKYFHRNYQDKVIKFNDPVDLNKLIDLDPHKKLDELKWIAELHKIIDFSVHTHHPLFFNQLFTGSDEYTCLAELISVILNTSMYTYEMAPVFTLMENTLFERIKEIFHFKGGDAMISPGGSASNILAIHAARYALNSKYNEIGTPHNLKIFISSDAHYSFIKGAAFLGLGYNSIIKIPTRNSKMHIGVLEQRIKCEIDNGNIPLMVVATAGTTVFGMFDDMNRIAKICKKYKIWLHVDAAWGGSVIFSNKYKYLLEGIECADSLTWNPHKMLRVPLQCSLLLIRDIKIATECNHLDASYLFQSDKSYDITYDLGKKHIMCGRKNDILKLWTVWKIRGEDQFEKDIDQIFILRDYFITKLTEHPKFQLFPAKSESTNVCFWYVLHENMPIKELNKIAPKIKRKMLEDGKIMISYQPHGSLPNFFRIVFINPLVTFSDLDKVIELIDEYGTNI